MQLSDRAALAAAFAAGVVAAEFVRWLLNRRTGAHAALLMAKAPPESTIRLMTRLAIKHGAVNLSQGFPNEPPPTEMLAAGAGALLAGENLAAAEAMGERLKAVMMVEAEKDQLNQYSFPFGMPLLRERLQAYFAAFYPEIPADADKNITVVLGATEGFAVCLRALCSPGDNVAFFQPFHELYPSQCTIFGLNPRAVTLREGADGWSYDAAELDAALSGARVLLLCTPHNPTGKIFSRAELQQIGAACERHGVLVVTDEIYEHITFDGATHTSIAQLSPALAARTCVVSALSKTARSTGWRVGWVVSPEAYTPAIRACHDQLVLQAPTPLQVGAAACLALPRTFFAAIRSEYAEKMAVLAPALARAGFVQRAPVHGAYYLFVDYRGVPALQGLDPTAAAMKMTTDFKVACVPGDNFYLGRAKGDAECGQKYIRFTFVRSLDVLRQAVAKLDAMAVK